jgi:hypothetical protein
MKRLNLLFVAAVTLSLTGCYLSETIETRIALQGEGNTFLIVTEYGNISSGEAKLSDVKNDFDMLVRDWQGDQYLLDRAAEGLFVKNRELFIRDDKLVGRVTGIMRNLDEHYDFWDIRGERIMLFKDSKDDYELVETNGKVVKTEKNTLIVWPENAPELHWKQRYTGESESFYKNQPIMLKMFKEYLANQKKAAPGQ